MKNTKRVLHAQRTAPGRCALTGRFATALVVLIGVGWGLGICRAQPANGDVPGEQVLTRGPVHEAFAGIVTFNPTPGIIVTKAPPGLIEEVPPDQRPEGDNVTWIPGYWAWDDERSDFLWVSGTWRALPPGRAWMAGYWAKTPQGYQWTSGYWADATAHQTTYLAAPPPSIEAGPNIAAPSIDYSWTPGCWLWYQGRYAWGPGYWAQGQSAWDWTPSHYVWTPRGYIFVGGFWDYSVERRGVLFAPVLFAPGLYSRQGYHYSPTIVVDLGVFTDHLFLRPHYDHYYFGDYYGAADSRAGFHAAFSFQSGRLGYDPLYSHQRWVHRSDREWEHSVVASYQYRRDHEDARPPRTWAEQRRLNPNTAGSQQNRAPVAMPINQLATRKGSPVHLQPVASAERQKLMQRGPEVQTSRDQRRAIETKPVETAGRKPGAVRAPAKAPLAPSPIVAKPASQFVKSQAPPKVQRAPKPDLRVQPASPTVGRQPNADRNHPQPQARKPQAEKPTPGRSELKSGAMNAMPAPGLRPAKQPAVSTLGPQAPARQNLGKFVAPTPKASSISESKARQASVWSPKHEQMAKEQGRPKPTKGQE